jgi:cyclic pyranopterin phosphate synthase
MKDISGKKVTRRRAIATARLEAAAATITLLKRGALPKGDPIPVAKVAAIQAAKNTSQIIPYCHPLQLEHVKVDFNIGTKTIDITVTTDAIYKTGVEMEALTAASVAALTLYDMMKGVDPLMLITNVGLQEKTGGKSDIKRRKGK